MRSTNEMQVSSCAIDGAKGRERPGNAIPVASFVNQKYNIRCIWSISCFLPARRRLMRVRFGFHTRKRPCGALPAGVDRPCSRHVAHVARVRRERPGITKECRHGYRSFARSSCTPPHPSPSVLETRDSSSRETPLRGRHERSHRPTRGRDGGRAQARTPRTAGARPQLSAHRLTAIGPSVSPADSWLPTQSAFFSRPLIRLRVKGFRSGGKAPPLRSSLPPFRATLRRDQCSRGAARCRDSQPASVDGGGVRGARSG